jgi:hypothetical protein
MCFYSCALLSFLEDALIPLQELSAVKELNYSVREKYQINALVCIFFCCSCNCFDPSLFQLRNIVCLKKSTLLLMSEVL